MSSEVAIRASNIGKIYRIYDRPEHRLIQMATLGRVRRFREFAALQDISFEVHRGETVGIVGRNGCGKSTLLQIVCGTLQPTNGSAEVHGRLAALLELGAGFNGEFSGRENAYLNGALLGFSRQEMEERFDSIASFAGIGDFIEQPVKTYSSGMFVRLAFAVAISVDPDILVIDEALAVGDEAFQRKCFARIEEIKKRGATILFVSHDAQSVLQLCDRALLIDQGEKLLDGPPAAVVAQYQRLVNLDPTLARQVREEIRALTFEARTPLDVNVAPAEVDQIPAPARTAAPPSEAWFDPALVSQSGTDYEPRGAVIRDLRLLTLQGSSVNVIESRHRYRFVYETDFLTDCADVAVGMMIKNVSGIHLGGATTFFQSERRISNVTAGSTMRVEFEFDCALYAGTYFANAGVLGLQDGEHHYLHRRLDAFAFRVAKADPTITGIVDIQPVIRTLVTAAARPASEEETQETASA
ncbi:MAG: lipopolysaccharide transport system ATP-binding protein [Variibacter sp.]|nr:lipopolysaccharide transport system ATP-binding protein [Variibacter sp.]